MIRNPHITAEEKMILNIAEHFPHTSSLKVHAVGGSRITNFALRHFRGVLTPETGFIVQKSKTKKAIDSIVASLPGKGHPILFDPRLR